MQIIRWGVAVAGHASAAWRSAPRIVIQVIYEYCFAQPPTRSPTRDPTPVIDVYTHLWTLGNTYAIQLWGFLKSFVFIRKNTHRRLKLSVYFDINYVYIEKMAPNQFITNECWCLSFTSMTITEFFIYDHFFHICLQSLWCKVKNILKLDTL